MPLGWGIMPQRRRTIYIWYREAIRFLIWYLLLMRSRICTFPNQNAGYAVWHAQGG